MKHLTASGPRWALVAAYVLLVFTLQPLLLDHTFAAGSSPEHSDQDVCAWLDHSASAGLQSSVVPIVLVQTVVFASSFFTASFHITDRSHDPVRGPPVLI